MNKAAEIARKVVPERIGYAGLVGAIVGFVSTLMLFIGSFNETDAGLVVIPLWFFMVPSGAFLWFLLNRILYGNGRHKWLIVLGLILLVTAFFLPSPLLLTAWLQ